MCVLGTAVGDSLPAAMAEHCAAAKVGCSVVSSKKVTDLSVGAGEQKNLE